MSKNKKSMLELTTDPDQQVSSSSTWCGNCIFADFENDVQIGCKANRLQKFKNANIPVLQTQVDGEDTTSFVIDGKSCVYYRNKTWAQSHYPDQSDTGLLTSIQNELRIPYHAIIFLKNHEVDNNPNNTYLERQQQQKDGIGIQRALDNLKHRLSELKNQAVKPKLVTIVNRLHSIKDYSSDIINMTRNCGFEHWKLQTVQAIDQSDRDVVDLVYDNTKKLQYMFYICFECDDPIPADMSSDIHKSLHDDMKAFTVLVPHKGNVGLGALKAAHAKYSGNAFAVLLEDKIIHYDDSPHLIKKAIDICPSLQTS